MFKFLKKIFSYLWMKSEPKPRALNVAAQEEASKNSPMSLSFSGGGFLALYQIGAVKALREEAPEILNLAPKVYGSSGGSLVAAAVVFELNLDDIMNILLEAAAEARKTILGPLCPSFNLIKNLRNALLLLLPDNAHQLATGRLYIALTRLADLKDLFVSDYKSKEEVVQVLICGCFLPFYCGIIPPSFRGVILYEYHCHGYRDAMAYLNHIYYDLKYSSKSKKPLLLDSRIRNVKRNEKTKILAP